LTRYLLDTSVLSLMAPGRPGVPPTLADWFRAQSEYLFISTITVAEIEQGIGKLRRTGGEPRAALLAQWLDALLDAQPDRILSFDVEAAKAAGQISDAALSKGRHPGFADVAIAAIAASHDMLLLTTNGRHFEPLGIAYADPSSAEFLEADRST
jgi:predicted nucleic acid-binding protein